MRFPLAALLFVALVTVSFGLTMDLDTDWEIFKMEFDKTYAEGEEPIRRLIFEDNFDEVTKHNEEAAEGLHSFTCEMNEFADMTAKEFFDRHTGSMDANHTDILIGETFDEEYEGADLPEYVNWLEKGVVTHVKNQGRCGSCWAFSALGSLEAQHAFKTRKLVSLSEQNLVDCVRESSGCRGGLMHRAFRYIIKNEGVNTEESYPYEGRDGRCRFNSENIGATMTSFKIIQPGNEKAMKYAVANIGPISVGMIFGKVRALMFYKKGIVSTTECKNKKLNHALVVVGYGTEKGTDYWIVKNSWGASWGQAGYLRVKRGENMCGIASYSLFPIV